jgi:ABC-2 type transport system permease protein
VRAFNPTLERDGYEPLGSVLETNSDDWPFLVDSVSAALEQRGERIARLVHPIMGVTREDGRLTGVTGARNAIHRESVMHFDLARKLSDAELADLAERVRGVAPLEVRVRPKYNPALRSAAYIVPGIIGVLLSMTMLIITAIAIVRERERGTLEQLVVTPIDKTSLMLGKIVPFVLVGYVQMTVVILLGRLLFDIPVRGSLPLLYALTFAFIVDMLGLGLFVSTVVRTQAQAIQLGFFFMLPTILLSGFMFPRQAMPAPAQWLGLALPLTYYLQVLRGILLKGVGLEYLWREFLALVAFGVLIITLSVKRFAKTVE